MLSVRVRCLCGEELIFKAHRLVYHSTLGSRVIQKKKRTVRYLLLRVGFHNWGVRVRVWGEAFRFTVRVWGLGFSFRGLGFDGVGFRFRV
jgi:hypothetical protein